MRGREMSLCNFLILDQAEIKNNYKKRQPSKFKSGIYYIKDKGKGAVQFAEAICVSEINVHEKQNNKTINYITLNKIFSGNKFE